MLTKLRTTGRSRRAKVAITIGVGAMLMTGCAEDGPEPIEDGATAFATLDESGDSFLDADEVAEWVDERGVFGVWDIDEDSELDRDEIAGNAFELWDSDGSGRIDEDEWERGTELWYPDDNSPVVLADVDGDGDSELDADEFTEAVDASILGERWSTDTLDERTFKVAYFELYDADDDGRVSEMEWSDGAATFGTSVEG